MAWGCALCLALAGGALLALLVQLLRWLRADGDLTLLWAENWGKKPGNAARQQPRQGDCGGAGRGRGALPKGGGGEHGRAGGSGCPLGLSINIPQKCNLSARYLDEERGAPRAGKAAPKKPLRGSRGSVPWAGSSGPELFVWQSFWAGSRSWQGPAEQLGLWRALGTGTVRREGSGRDQGA